VGQRGVVERGREGRRLASGFASEDFLERVQRSPWPISTGGRVPSTTPRIRWRETFSAQQDDRRWRPAGENCSFSPPRSDRRSRRPGRARRLPGRISSRKRAIGEAGPAGSPAGSARGHAGRRRGPRAANTLVGECEEEIEGDNGRRVDGPAPTRRARGAITRSTSSARGPAVKERPPRPHGERSRPPLRKGARASVRRAGRSRPARGVRHPRRVRCAADCLGEVARAPASELAPSRRGPLERDEHRPGLGLRRPWRADSWTGGSGALHRASHVARGTGSPAATRVHVTSTRLVDRKATRKVAPWGAELHPGDNPASDAGPPLFWTAVDPDVCIHLGGPGRTVPGPTSVRAAGL